MQNWKLNPSTRAPAGERTGKPRPAPGAPREGHGQDRRLNGPLYLLWFLAAGALTSCAPYQPALAARSTQYLVGGGQVASQSYSPLPDSVSYWDGQGLSGSPRIEISLSRQRAYFYKGTQLVGVSILSTGREGKRTPPGNFKIIQKSPTHVSNLYGDYVDSADNVVVASVDNRVDPMPAGTRFRGASMPYFMRVHGAVGLHAGFLPGYPASAGCIRMPDRMARHFYDNAPLGTPVSIHN